MISTDIIDSIINADSTDEFFDFLKIEEYHPACNGILVNDAINGDDKFLDSIIKSLLDNNEENSSESVLELDNLFDESSLENHAISVLGVNLNLNTDCLDNNLSSTSSNELNELTLGEKVSDYFITTPSDYPFLMDTPPIYQEYPDIMSMFPHMNDEKNRRRRNFLYENNSNHTQLSTSTKSEKKFDKLYFKKRDHDYTQKFIADNEKYFTCPILNCDKIYAKSSHLKAHLRRHSGEKPFVCNWKNCTWKFSRSDELARHKRSHSGIKPYKCEICDKAFARSDHLSKHKKIHKKKITQGGGRYLDEKAR